MKQQFLHLPSWVLVAGGGVVGVAAREGLILAMPQAGTLPWAVVLANLVGAFALGLLYAALDRRSSTQVAAPIRPAKGAPRGRQLRLLLGTGFCGGFTTYSTFAVGIVLLGTGSAGPAWAAVYAVGVVTAGALATWAGLALGSNLPTGRESRTDNLESPDISRRGREHQ